MASGGSTRAILAAMFANMGIAIAKFIGFLVTSSSSMLAESVHSVADTTNQALLLWGGRRAKREATTEHPFGYGRERYFWAFVVALILFSLGSLFAIYEGTEKIRHPEELESLYVAIGILVFGILLESYSLRTAVVESNRVRGNASWSQFVRRSRSPELPVVLLEDIGAMFGLVVALFAVVMAKVTDEPRWDGIGTLSIGIVLGLIAVTLAVEMKSLLIGEGAIPADRQRLVDTIESHPLVDRVIHLRTQHLGPDELLVATKIHFDESLDIGGLARAIDDLETKMRDAVPVARVIYVEPDLFRSDTTSST